MYAFSTTPPMAKSSMPLAGSRTNPPRFQIRRCAKSSRPAQPLQPKNKKNNPNPPPKTHLFTIWCATRAAKAQPRAIYTEGQHAQKNQDTHPRQSACYNPLQIATTFTPDSFPNPCAKQCQTAPPPHHRISKRSHSPPFPAQKPTKIPAATPNEAIFDERTHRSDPLNAPPRCWGA
jgi:hypothetical protein